MPGYISLYSRRTRDPTRTRLRRLGPCTAERETPRPSALGGSQSRRSPETIPGRHQQICDRSPPSDRPNLGPPPPGSKEILIQAALGRLAGSTRLSLIRGYTRGNQYQCKHAMTPNPWPRHLRKYARGPLAELWKRSGLRPRDRSIVTLPALIARNQTTELSYYFGLALDSGVNAKELSEVITHLAFYAGWPNAMSAAAAAKSVFVERKIGANELPAASPTLLALDENAEGERAIGVEQQFGKVAPRIVHYTTDVHPIAVW